MSFTVRQSPLVDQQEKILRNKQKKRYEEFLDDLARRGCAALGYRLAGPTPLAHMCVKHIVGTLRVVVAFAENDEIWVLLVGYHDESDPGINVYSTLYDLAGIDTAPSGKRTKPPCCGEDGDAPLVDEAFVDEFVERAKRLARER